MTVMFVAYLYGLRATWLVFEIVMSTRGAWFIVLLTIIIQFNWLVDRSEKIRFKGHFWSENRLVK